MDRLDAVLLKQAQRVLPLPFLLGAETDDGEAVEVRVSEILRVLPGRRIAGIAHQVAPQTTHQTAEQDDRKLFVKLFIGRGARRYFRRDLNGMAAIKKAGVPTPDILWHGKFDGDGYIIAFSYIDNAVSLLDKWHTQNPNLLDGLMDNALEILARLHSAGVRQNDIHLDNFLVRPEADREHIYVLDGGGVSRGGLSQRVWLDNLALFFAQFSQPPDDIDAVLASYCQHRGWPKPPVRAKALLAKINKHRRAIKRRHLRKAYRECTRFVCERSWSQFLVCQRDCYSPDMRSFLKQLDAAIAAGEPLKAGNTATVAAVNSPVGKLVVKRYNIKDIRHLLGRLFRPSRAWRAWGAAWLLEFYGIRTPIPIAMLEERMGPLRRRAYLVSKYEAAPSAATLPNLEPHQQEAAIAGIANLIKQLDKTNITHGDLKSSNFLLTTEGVALIDLDSVRDCRSFGRWKAKAHNKDIARFLRNWDDSPDIKAAFTNLLQ
ncbi:MAG: lipopolysaccharide kinase InaA family protein [Pseudomonadales bacterium]